MSTAVVSTSAAPGRPFLFDAESQEYCHPERSEKCAKRISHGVEGSLGPLTDPRLTSITPASRLELRPAPEMVTSGIPALDALTGGLPRGCLTEICGSASSGRTSVMLAALAAATHRGEYCAVIDASDALDPHSLAATGIDLDRLLWVRCDENSPQRKNSPRNHPSTSLRASFDTEKTNRGKEFSAIKGFAKEKIGKGSASAVPYSVRNDAVLAAGGRPFHLQEYSFKQINTDQIFKTRTENSYGNSKTHQSEHRLEQVLRATDLLLESGGFGLIILDLADLPNEAARRIPLTTWFRFRRAVEHKPTILLAIEQQAIAGSCSSLLLQLGSSIARDKNSIKANISDEPVAKRQKNTAHGVSRGSNAKDDRAPEGQKTFCIPGEAPLDFPSHAHLLTELKIHAELIRSRLDRKPARSVAFETKTAWAG